MPAHVRKQIRAAVTSLLNGLPSTGTRVHPGRVRPIGSASAPALFVYSTEENSDTGAMGSPPPLVRELVLVVEGRIHSSADDPEDALDSISVEVETAVGANPFLGGLVYEMTLISTKIDMQAQGETLAASVVMQYRVQYKTAEGAPTVAL